MKTWHHILALFILLHLLFVGIAPFPELPFGIQPKVRAWGADYATFAGTRQSWRMFSGPPTKSGRLEIAMSDESGDWTVLYQERSTKYTWNADRFDHYRWREKIKQFNKGRKQSAFKLFCKDIAEEVFDEFEAAESIRIQVKKGRAPKPRPGKRRWTKFDKLVEERIIERVRQ